ncbi:MAG: DUF2975 domain-containing protein [Caulobacteraceae bacterium]
MTEAAVAPLVRAQKLAGVAATVAVVSAILIAIGAVASNVVAPAAEALRSQEVTLDWRGALNLVRAVGAFVVLAVPSFLLAGALLDLSSVLDEYGKGRFFTLKASAGVRKAAESALWALAFKVLISPTIFSWITHEGRGFIWHLEPFDLGLIAFAAFVAVLGRVLEAAARIKQENDEIV